MRMPHRPSWLRATRLSRFEGRCVYIWDVQTKQVVQKLEGHGDTVVGVACHPRLSVIASCSLGSDPTVRIWVDDPPA